MMAASMLSSPQRCASRSKYACSTCVWGGGLTWVDFRLQLMARADQRATLP
jgi:hypothetical protein